MHVTAILIDSVVLMDLSTSTLPYSRLKLETFDTITKKQ